MCLGGKDSVVCVTSDRPPDTAAVRHHDIDCEQPATPDHPAEAAPTPGRTQEDPEEPDDPMTAIISDFRKKHESNFILGHVNINSFRHKFPFISDILCKRHFDYLAISESKLDSSFTYAQFHIEGFSMYRQDNTDKSGGIIVYIRSDLPHRRLTECEYNGDGFESLSIEVTIGTSKSVISCIYKHPCVKNEVFKSKIANIVDKNILICDDFTLIGDMNCCPRKSKTIADICDLYDLSNLIKQPTCHKGEVPTILDVILVSNKKRYAGVLNTPCNISDFHHIIGTATRRHAPFQKPRQIVYRSYKRLNDDDFREDILNAPFHVCEVFDDVEDMAWFTSKLISDIVDAHAPLKSKTITSNPVPYMNSELRKAIYSRNMIRNKFRKYGNMYWEANRRHRNHVVAIRKKSLSAYFSKKCAKKDKSFWSTVKPFISDNKIKNNSNIILREGGETIVDNKGVSDTFNEYFASIASSIGFKDSVCSGKAAIEKHKYHPSVMKINETYGGRFSSFDFVPICENDIRHKLKNIDIKKATGYDKIPGKLLRLAHNELASPLTFLINTCMGRHIYPGVMKFAEVSPIYKKADNLVKNNYRPVSVLTILSKLYEGVMNDQLHGHFSTIFNDLLSAFRRGYSCQALLIKMIDDWKVSLDNKEFVGAIFMDLSKAFDCLPPGLLVSKLHAYGLSSSACDLMYSYLSDRYQRVKVGNERSEWLKLEKGVPQGSILGPVLFNIFMNDLFLFMEKCKLYNYADDNSMSKTSVDLQTVLHSLRHDGDIAIKWFSENGMQANPEKFQFMIMSPTPVPPQTITLNNDVCITSEPLVKILGVLVDDGLKFNEHVSACCTKAARQLNALARISRYLEVPSKRLIYESFILSNFNYCPLVWHFCGKQNNGKLEKINERALRILYKNYTSSYTELLQVANSTSLLTSRLDNMTVEVFKCLKCVNPPILNDMFVTKSVSYSLRNPIRIIQPVRRTTQFGIRSVSYIGAKLWNDLPLGNIHPSDIDICDFKLLVRSLQGSQYDESFTSFI